MLQVQVTWRAMYDRRAVVRVPVEINGRIQEVTVTAIKENGRWVGNNPDFKGYEARNRANAQLADLRVAMAKARGNRMRSDRQIIARLIRAFREKLAAVYAQYPERVEFV